MIQHNDKGWKSGGGDKKRSAGMKRGREEYCKVEEVEDE
jgi:hypothetical protein